MEYIDIINYISDKIILDLIPDSITSKHTSFKSKGGSNKPDSIKSDSNEHENKCIKYIIKLFPKFFNEKNELVPEISKYYQLFKKTSDPSKKKQDVLTSFTLSLTFIITCLYGLFISCFVYKYVITNTEIIQYYDYIVDEIGLFKCFFYLNMINFIFILITRMVIHKDTFDSHFFNTIIQSFVQSISTPINAFLSLFNLQNLSSFFINNLDDEENADLDLGNKSNSSSDKIDINNSQSSLHSGKKLDKIIYDTKGKIIYFNDDSSSEDDNSSSDDNNSSSDNNNSNIYNTESESDSNSRPITRKKNKEGEIINNFAYDSDGGFEGGSKGIINPFKNSSMFTELKKTFIDTINLFKKNFKNLVESDNKIDYIFNLFEKEIFQNTNKFKYEFNLKTGLIVCISKPSYTQLETQILFDPKIIMKTNEDKTIIYKINNIIFDSTTTSLIEGKPIHTALVIAYNYYNKKNKIIDNKIEYKYYLNPNGFVEVFDINTNKEVASVNSYLKSENDEIKDKTCKEIFGVNYNKDSCSKHFFNIIGRAGLALLQNLNESNISLIKYKLLEANPSIQYEILKTLNWKIKLDINKKKYLISVNDWLEINQNNLYKNYLNTNFELKNLLDDIINKINKNTSFLNY